MRLNAAAAAIAVIGALGLLAAPADAAAKKKKEVVYSNGQTVFVSRGEDGKTRTRIIVQRRSYLDPGTETFPGERSNYDYAVLPTHRADGILDNTTFGGNQQPLPGPFTLPFKDNPWIGGY
jgi:hypothetical protein